MKAVGKGLESVRINQDWAKLPLFDRSKWQRVKFGDVVENVNETERDPVGAGIERYIGMQHLEPGSLHIQSWGALADGTKFNRRCRPGQTLFGKRRAYQRKVAVTDFDAVVSGDIYVLSPSDKKLLPDLLPFLCLSERFIEHAVGTSAGSLSPRTNWSSLAAFEFDLPPIAHQRLLSEVLRSANSVLSGILCAVKDAEALRRSHLREAFSDKHQYRLRLVKEVGGVLLGRRRAPEYLELKFTFPYLRVANVMDGYIDFKDVLDMKFNERDLDTFRLEPGDILLNEGQSVELIGRSAIFNGEIQDCCFQSTLLRFRAGKDVMPKWAQAYFQHCLYSGIFAREAPQTTSMAHLTSLRFSNMKFPVPDISIQKVFANEHRRLILAVKALKMNQLASVSNLSGLLNTIF